jgi:transposase
MSGARAHDRGRGVGTARVAVHDRAFEDQAAWLTARAPATAVPELLRTTWRSVTCIVERAVAEAAGGRSVHLAGLRRMGIDEVAYRKGHRYLTVVVDHDTGRLVWAGKGRDQAVVRAFFDALGEQRAKQLTHVSTDAAEWITSVVAERAPQAVRCLDPFHLVAWATKALDDVRRGVWNAARSGKGKRTKRSVALKGARWPLWRNPETVTEQQRFTLAFIQITNKPLYRAYLLKEQFREIFSVGGQAGKLLLATWLRWAARCRIPRSSAWPNGSDTTSRASTQPSTMDCRTPGSRPTTPTCGS